jgi:hypothetical protein
MPPPVKPGSRRMAVINGFDGDITRLRLAATALDL